MARISKKAVTHVPFSEMVPNPINSHPERWPEWYVGLSAPTEVTGEGEVGTVSEHTFLLAGRHFPITHKVVEHQRRHRRPLEGHLRGLAEWLAPLDLPPGRR